MKKNALFLLLLFVLMAGGIYVSRTQNVPFVEDDVELTAADVPGDGFAMEDPCGFLMGSSLPYQTKYVNADSVSPDRKQACADSSGNFYRDQSPFTPRESEVILHVGSATTYTVDLVGLGYGVTVDQTTGYWSGYGKITDASFTGTNPWVWFDWNCMIGDGTSGAASCGGTVSSNNFRVRTNLDTGVVVGYAWNDNLGFISFRALTMELPPHEIQVFVDVLANDSDTITPHNVSLDTAPFSDFAQYWRVRVQWWDATAGEFLEESDFASNTIDLALATVGEVFLNQVTNEGEAIYVSTYNSYVGCSGASADDYCGMTESDGSWSANIFVYSGSPTSNMLGYDEDGDSTIEHYVDREGCRWIYEDQWMYGVDATGSPIACTGASSSEDAKDEVFFLRKNARNMVGIEALLLDFDLNTGREYGVAAGNGVLTEITQAGSELYYHMPNYNTDLDQDGAADGLYLSFRPRFQPMSYVAVYDGEQYTQISNNVDRYSRAPYMELITRATVYDASLEAQARAIPLKPAFTVYYQLDAESEGSTSPAEDRYLILDTMTGDSDEEPDCSFEMVALSAGSYSNDYVTSLNMGYGQRSETCTGMAPVGTPSNTLTAPTAEQWVCDQVTYDFDPTVESCYYTGYLPLIDRYDDPQAMLVIGAINSVLNDESVLTNLDQISVLGSTETIKLRNKMYAQLLRYTLGQSAGPGALDDEMNPSSGILSLMNGRLLFARGNVVVNGSAAFTDKTLVTIGGNVYIKGDVTGGRLGVIAFKDAGVGGNVYVDPSVTDLYANFFLDGSLYSYDGVTVSSDTPVWINDETRLETLSNQLYLNGSLVARNTVNGAAEAVSTDAGGQYDLGDGTTGGYEEAREHDLNLLRQYRLCFPIDPVTSLPDSTASPELCNEGEMLSDYGATNGLYNSFILEYAPASDLPIFTSEGTLF